MLGAQLALFGKQAHGEQGDENDEGIHHVHEVDRHVVAGLEIGGKAADKRGGGKEDAGIDVSDGIDEIRFQLFFINGQHGEKPFFCIWSDREGGRNGGSFFVLVVFHF